MKAIKRWWKLLWCTEPHLSDQVMMLYPMDCRGNEFFISLRPECQFLRDNPTFPSRWRVMRYRFFDADGYGNWLYTLELATQDGKSYTRLQTSRTCLVEERGCWLPFKDILLDVGVEA